MFERRRGKRKKAYVAVSFKDDIGREYEQELGCRDLSIYGVQVVSAHRFFMGQVVKVEVGLFSDVIPIKLEARVLWSRRDDSSPDARGYLMGLEFIHEDRLMKERLGDYIKRRGRRDDYG